MIPHIMYIILYMLKLKTYASNSTKIQKTLSHLLSPPLTILHLSIYLPLYPPFPISLIHTLSSSSLYIYYSLYSLYTTPYLSHTRYPISSPPHYTPPVKPLQECHMKFGSWTYDGTKLNLTLTDESSPVVDMSTYSESGEWIVLS